MGVEPKRAQVAELDHCFATGRDSRMSTYGRKRKKAVRSESSSFFSDTSDGEDTGATHSGGGASSASTSWGQLPAQLSPKKKVAVSGPGGSRGGSPLRNSPNKRINLSELENDPLTRSPKRLTRTIEALQFQVASSREATSGSRSPSRSPSPTPARRRRPQTGGFGAKQSGGAHAATHKPAFTSPVAKATTPKESSAWESLFGGLQEAKAIERLDIISKLNKDLESIVAEPSGPSVGAVPEGRRVGGGAGGSTDDDDDSDDNSSKKNGKVEDLLGLDLASFYSETDKTAAKVQSTRSRQLRTGSAEPSLSPVQSRTYGNVRSYLEDRDEPAQEQTEGQHEEPQQKDINDLKTLGKLSRQNEELEYVLEGLKLVAPPPGKAIESANQFLINCLIDLAMDLWGDRELTFQWKKQQQQHDHLSLVLSKVQALWAELPEGGSLIESLLVILLCGIFAKADGIEDVAAISKVVPLARVPTLHVSSATLLRNYPVSSVCKKNLRRLVKVVPDDFWEPEDKPKVLLAEGMCQKSAGPDFEYFQAICAFWGKRCQRASEVLPQTMEALTAGVAKINNVFELINDDEECLGLIELVITEGWGGKLDLQILEMLVLLSTKLEDTSERLAECIFQVHQKVIAEILAPCFSANDGKESDNASLLALGYLLNVVEFGGRNSELAISQLVEMFNGLPAEPKNEAETHLYGYFALIMGILRAEIGSTALRVKEESIKRKLEHFRNEVSSIGRTRIYEKINSLLRGLN